MNVNECPKCKGHFVGKITMKNYFCASCCLEFAINERGGVDYFYSDPSGVMVKASSESEVVRYGGKR